jgi:hypothetical protein
MNQLGDLPRIYAIMTTVLIAIAVIVWLLLQQPFAD